MLEKQKWLIGIHNMSTLQKLYVELSKSSTKNSYFIVLVIKSSRIGQTNLYWGKNQSVICPWENRMGVAGKKYDETFWNDDNL